MLKKGPFYLILLVFVALFFHPIWGENVYYELEDDNPELGRAGTFRNKKSLDPSIMDYLQESGQSYAFDPYAEASQAFDSQCAGYLGGSGLPALVSQYVTHTTTANRSQIKTAERYCFEETVKEDQILQQSLSAIERFFNLAHLQLVFHSSNIYQESPETAHELQEFFQKFEEYNTQCRDPLCKGSVQGANLYQARGGQSNISPLSTQCFNAGNFIQAVKILGANSCKEKRDDLISLAQDQNGALAYLARLPTRLCPGSGSGCVAELRAEVGLSQNQKSLFASCGEELSSAVEHCRNPESDESISQYRAQLQNASSGQCESANLHNVQTQTAGKMQKACGEAVGICKNNCQVDVVNFRDKFFDCFAIPHLENKNAYLHHPQGGACANHIDQIIGQYNRQAVDASTNQRYDLHLTREENGAVLACEKPLNEMKRDLESRSKALAQNLCGQASSQTAENSSSNENSPSSNSSSALSSLSLRRSGQESSSSSSHRGPSSSGTSRSSSSSAAYVEYNGDLSTRIIPGISHIVQNKEDYIKYWEMAGLEAPHPDDLVYLEGDSIPMTREEVEAKLARQANIGRPGYNDFGIKIDHSLPVCSKGICPNNAPRYPGEGLPSDSAQAQAEASSQAENAGAAPAEGADRSIGDAFVETLEKGKKLAKAGLRYVLSIPDRKVDPNPTAGMSAERRENFEYNKKKLESAPVFESLKDSFLHMVKQEKRFLEWACQTLRNKSCAEMNTPNPELGGVNPQKVLNPEE